MPSMINHKLVLPEHLNHYGYLFGGYLLRWVDEYSYIAANLDFPGHRFVTRGLDKVAFRESIRLGSVLRFEIVRSTLGKTSATYEVNVYSDNIDSKNMPVNEALVFSTNITFVNINEDGSKQPINQRR
jgi:acyl-CoA hydrolase